MRRSRLLKYSCIVLMLAALARTAFGIMMLNFYATARTFGAVGKPQLNMAVITLVLVMLGAAAELVSGFIGALNWEEPLNAGKCTVWGTAALVTGAAGNLMQALTGYGVSYVAWATGVIAPLIFFCAALRFYLSNRRRSVPKKDR